MLQDRPSSTLPQSTTQTKDEATMKPAHIFRDQVNTVAQWFAQWNDIEQTIACYSLLKRLGPTQARFLSLVLEHTFRDSAFEVGLLEQQANSRDFLKSLCHESKDVAVQQLLFHLPLLHPGNDDARAEYLNLLPKILAHSLEHAIHEEECRQLLSLALVHPAFAPEERNSLSWWLGHLEEKGEHLKDRHRPPPGFASSHDGTSSGGHQRLSATKSCDVWGPGRGVTKPNGWRAQPQLIHTDSGISTSFDNGLSSPRISTASVTTVDDTHQDGVGIVNRPSRSQSFPVDPQRMHAQLSPQSSLDSDEDCVTRRYSLDEVSIGMKDVPTWLKSLRLHKYSDIFCEMAYEDMLELSEDFLETKGVTKGARNKMILSIQKLKERSQILASLEKEVLQIGKLSYVLNELKQILLTPIRPYFGTEVQSTGEPTATLNNQSETPDPEDLPTQITRVMGKACTQILVTQPDEEFCLTYLGLLDRALTHEAFTQTQKRRLHSWKTQCQKLARQLATNRKIAGIEKGSRNWFDPLGHGISAINRRRQSNRGGSLKNSSSSGLNCVSSRPGGLLSNFHKPLAPSASVNVVKSHQPICRTNSAPIRSSQPPVVFLPPNLAAQDTDGINKSLETLCLSMTEHALEDTTADKTDRQF